MAPCLLPQFLPSVACWLWPLVYCVWEWMTDTVDYYSHEQGQSPVQKPQLKEYNTVFKWKPFDAWLRAEGEGTTRLNGTEFSDNKEHRLCWLHPIIKCKPLLSWWNTRRPRCLPNSLPYNWLPLFPSEPVRISGRTPGAKNRPFSDRFSTNVLKTNTRLCFCSIAQHWMSGGCSVWGMLCGCAPGVLARAVGFQAEHRLPTTQRAGQGESSLRRYPLPLEQNKTKPLLWSCSEKVFKSVLFDFSLISLFFWNDLWLSKFYPGPSVLWSWATVLRNKPQNKLTNNNGRKHFHNTWNVEGLSDCFLERGGCTEGSPRSHDDMYCSSKEQGEIRKDNLWWRTKQAGDRREPFPFALLGESVTGPGQGLEEDGCY